MCEKKHSRNEKKLSSSSRKEYLNPHLERVSSIVKTPFEKLQLLTITCLAEERISSPQIARK
ncbi:hypothetical protein ACTXT7_001426 [Hymenolepis weldensis]